jgi:predicted component of type VI protein secretion system
MRLGVDAKQVQPMRLGGYQQLGWDTWLGHAPVENDVIWGATISPDHYEAIA